MESQFTLSNARTEIWLPLNWVVGFNWRSACGGGKCVVVGFFDIFDLDCEERDFVVENKEKSCN